MYIKNISLSSYRSYDKLKLDLSKEMNLIYGNNAQGKTNILEAIYICGTGKSHRTNNEKELIFFGKQESKIQLEVEKNYGDYTIDIHLNEKQKKMIKINGIPIKKIGDLLGYLNVVLFSPEDLSLIKSGPLERRRFMDVCLCQLRPRYFYDLTQYNKIIKQRNSLLKEIQKKPELKDTLFVWDEQLVKLGNNILKMRSQFIESISQFAKDIHSSITKEKEQLCIGYDSNVKIENFAQKLKESVEKDIYRGNTSVGPHKDDLSFKIGSLDIKVYGSQGQQRSTALSLKLAELEFIKKEIKEYPVLLLDDVMSELDLQRQNDLLKYVQGVQVLITGTSIDYFDIKTFKEISFFKVKEGQVTKESS